MILRTGPMLALPAALPIGFAARLPDDPLTGAAVPSLPSSGKVAVCVALAAACDTSLPGLASPPF
jgi:hypothetical protein